MGIKWSARLTVDFEMEEGAAADLAERPLRESAIEFQRLYRNWTWQRQHPRTTRLTSCGCHVPPRGVSTFRLPNSAAKLHGP
jgi:hypothetical protein